MIELTPIGVKSRFIGARQNWSALTHFEHTVTRGRKILIPYQRIVSKPTRYWYGTTKKTYVRANTWYDTVLKIRIVLIHIRYEIRYAPTSYHRIKQSQKCGNVLFIFIHTEHNYCPEWSKRAFEDEYCSFSATVFTQNFWNRPNSTQYTISRLWDWPFASENMLLKYFVYFTLRERAWLWTDDPPHTILGGERLQCRS